ncbi:MAG: hypothetical protein ABIF40_02900 [archaeon]
MLNKEQREILHTDAQLTSLTTSYLAGSINTSEWEQEVKSLRDSWEEAGYSSKKFEEIFKEYKRWGNIISNIENRI